MKIKYLLDPPDLQFFPVLQINVVAYAQMKERAHILDTPLIVDKPPGVDLTHMLGNIPFEFIRLHPGHIYITESIRAALHPGFTAPDFKGAGR